MQRAVQTPVKPSLNLSALRREASDASQRWDLDAALPQRVAAARRRSIAGWRGPTVAVALLCWRKRRLLLRLLLLLPVAIVRLVGTGGVTPGLLRRLRVGRAAGAVLLHAPRPKPALAVVGALADSAAIPVAGRRWRRRRRGVELGSRLVPLPRQTKGCVRSYSTRTRRSTRRRTIYERVHDPATGTQGLD